MRQLLRVVLPRRRGTCRQSEGDCLFFAYYGRRHVDASCYAHDFHWLHVLFKSVCFLSGPFRISDSSAYLDASLIGGTLLNVLCAVNRNTILESIEIDHRSNFLAPMIVSTGTLFNYWTHSYSHIIPSSYRMVNNCHCQLLCIDGNDWWPSVPLRNALDKRHSSHHRSTQNVEYELDD